MENLINTFIRNGGNRYFLITNVTSAFVTLEEYNGAGATDTYRRIPTVTFQALWKRKNYVTVRFALDTTGRWSERARDWEVERSIGAHRFMVKNHMPLF